MRPLAGGGFAQALRKQWCDFQPLADDGLVLCLRGSGRILFAQLPLCEGEHGPVFLFGAHDGPVLTLATNRELLLSGGADGCVRLWGLDSGALLDCCRGQLAEDGEVTAVTFVGSLMVAAGTQQGHVTLYDISTSRLVVVHRFSAGQGPVMALASRLTPRQMHDVVTASAPRGLDGGGVLAAPVGLPWRDMSEGSESGTDTLLAVSSPAAWLNVFRAARSGEAAWRVVHHQAVAGQPFLSFSPDGQYMALAAGLQQLVVHEQHFPPGDLVGGGFLPAAAGGSALVAMQLGTTLAGGIQLRLFAAPAREEPQSVQEQLTRPLLDPIRSNNGSSNSNRAQQPLDATGICANRDEDFLTWLQHPTTTASDDDPGSTPAPPAASPSPAPAPAPAEGSAATAALLQGLSLGSNRLAGAGAPAAGRASATHPLSPLPSPSPLPQPHPTWGWEAFASSPPTSQEAPLVHRNGDPHQAAIARPHWLPESDGGRLLGERSPSAGPLAATSWTTMTGGGTAAVPAMASPSSYQRQDASSQSRSPGPVSVGAIHGSAHETGQEGGGGDAACDAAGATHTWQAYRPATQPAPRSWITGLPPRADFLPRPVPPPPPFQQAPQTTTIKPLATAQPGSPSASPAATAATGPPSASPATSPVGGQLAAGTASRPLRGRIGSPQPAASWAARYQNTVLSGLVAEGQEQSGDCVSEPEPELPHSGALLPAMDRRRDSAAVAVPAFGGTIRHTAPVESADDDYPDLGLATEPEAVNLSTTVWAAVMARWCLVDLRDLPAGEKVTWTWRLRRASEPKSGLLPRPANAAHQIPQQSWCSQGADVGNYSNEPQAAASTAAVEDGGLFLGSQACGDAALDDTLRDWSGGSGFGEEDTEDDPLGRTAYLGTAIQAALQGGLDTASNDRAAAGDAFRGGPADRVVPTESLPRAEALGKEEEAEAAAAAAKEEEEAERPPRGVVSTEQRHGAAPHSFPPPPSRGHLNAGVAHAAVASGPTAAAGTEAAEGPVEALDGNRRGAAAELTRYLALPCAQEDPDEDEDEDEEESLPVPRGAAGLPLPQPEWSQERPKQRYRDIQGQDSQPATGREQQEGGEEEEEEEDGVSLPLPCVSRSVALDDFRAFQPLPQGAVAVTAVAAAAEKDAEQNLMWGDWSNADLLSRPGTVDNAAEDAVEGRYSFRGLKNPTVSSRPHSQPRQPPTFRSHRMELTALPRTATAAIGVKSSVAASAQDIWPPRQTHAGPHADVAATGSGRVTASDRQLPRQSQRPALSVFRGFKPSHTKVNQQLRKTQAPTVRAVADATAAVPLHSRYSAADDAEDEVGPEGSTSMAAEASAARQACESARPTARSSSARVGQVAMTYNNGDSSPARITECEVLVEEDEVEVRGEASPLDVPRLGSGVGMILRKMQSLAQVISRPVPTVAAEPPGGRRRGGGGGPVGMSGRGIALPEGDGLEPGVGEAVWEEAARRAATSAANVPPSVQLYRGLPVLEDPEKLRPMRAAKHLHPGWVASRQLKPELEALWRPTDHAHEACNTRGVAFYMPPTTAEIAASAVALQWLC
ncbi:hypothetical protein VOLCADRAFT_88779 [Volvox carteri f. nagariensis]|uniref:Uncharacterized protein n=1 Tax=Volvox carteri f. nagariensis TaxID=3068 RepID=D8TPX5_VOLCA|nr:uncharacterized protein VOLCADRAFT_88779 [Volvox carteri f. nagariensis]EFJ50437.1 hypothetical protein VOLCADRAFT_88779 [Volvox carteri f. nagariensis]|eukprot:XP_002948562.1 hypothetical protein VOLCADRAFT_88779 [Volvox carteri f. nagariensis]